MARPNPLKIWQANVDRARHVMDELRRAASMEGSDVLLIQEPYVHRGKVVGFGVADVILTGSPPEERPWAAVIVLNKSINVLHVAHLSTSHTVCVELTTEECSLVVVSCYMQFALQTEVFVEELRPIFHAYRDCKILIGTDANAKSPMWGSPNTDRAGRIIEDFIAEAQLDVLNDPTQGPTFSADVGESCIDVTVVSTRIPRNTTEWTLRPDILTGSHRLIEINIVQPRNAVQPPPRTLERFNLRRANWERFSEVLTNELQDITDIQNRPDLFLYARAITRAVLRAASASMPRRRYCRKAVPWWTDTLTDLKRMTYAARRDAQQAGLTQAEREERREGYRVIRRIYTRAIHSTKRESWRDFITEQATTNMWGVAYKIQAQKLTPTQVMTSVSTQQGFSKTWTEAATSILSALTVDDNEDEDGDQHRRIREEIRHSPDTEDSLDLDLLDVELACSRLRNKTAPGMDNVEVEFIKRGWPLLGPKLLHLYQACLTYGVFPGLWKHAQIKILLKHGDRDKTDPTSYRPISLLPVLGKVFERLLLNLLAPTLERDASGSQYGFKSSLSTEDAITVLFDTTRNAEDRLVIGLFIDFQGAFDALWWPSILHELKRRDCPRNLFSIIKDYFRGRTTSIVENTSMVRKQVSAGCPQGSVLGPKLWNLVMDGLLRRLEEEDNVKAVAFADDLVLIVPGRSRAEVERRGAGAIQIVEEWSQSTKLRISSAKTVGMILKGRLDPRRPPTIPLGERNIRFVQHLKYLGVELQCNLKMDLHVRSITEKAKILFMALARLGGQGWGYNAVNYRLLYVTLFQQICSYAAHGWARTLNNRQKKILLAAQRQVLLRVTKAYSTTSGVCLPVIAGVQPIDLYIELRIHLFRIRRELPTALEDTVILVEDYEDPDGRDSARRLIKEQLLSIWQRRWDDSMNGRITYSFLPNIRDRLNKTWIIPTHCVTQALSGHGAFRSRLFSLGLVGDAVCHCQTPGVDDIKHILYECSRYNCFRRDLEVRVQLDEMRWPPSLEYWTARTSHQVFRQYVTRVLGLRQNEDNRRRRER